MGYQYSFSQQTQFCVFNMIPICFGFCFVSSARPCSALSVCYDLWEANPWLFSQQPPSHPVRALVLVSVDTSAGTAQFLHSTSLPSIWPGEDGPRENHRLPLSVGFGHQDRKLWDSAYQECGPKVCMVQPCLPDAVNSLTSGRRAVEESQGLGYKVKGSTGQSGACMCGPSLNIHEAVTCCHTRLGTGLSAMHMSSHLCKSR